MSFGDASGAGASVLPAGPAAGLSACCAIAGFGRIETTHTAIAASIRTAAAPLMPDRLLEREHHQHTGVLRHALVGLAVQIRICISHHAAPSGRYRDILLAGCQIGD